MTTEKQLWCVQAKWQLWSHSLSADRFVWFLDCLSLAWSVLHRPGQPGRGSGIQLRGTGLRVSTALSLESGFWGLWGLSWGSLVSISLTELFLQTNGLFFMKMFGWIIAAGEILIYGNFFRGICWVRSLWILALEAKRSQLVILKLFGNWVK